MKSSMNKTTIRYINAFLIIAKLVYTLMFFLNTIGLILRNITSSNIGFLIPSWDPLEMAKYFASKNAIQITFHQHDFLVFCSSSFLFYGIFYMITNVETVIKNVKSNNFLSAESNNRIKKSGITIMIISFLIVQFKSITAYFITNTPAWALFSSLLFFFLDPLFLLGCVILIISYILEYSLEVKQENDLTV